MSQQIFAEATKDDFRDPQLLWNRVTHLQTLMSAKFPFGQHRKKAKLNLQSL